MCPSSVNDVFFDGGRARAEKYREIPYCLSCQDSLSIASASAHLRLPPPQTPSSCPEWRTFVSTPQAKRLVTVENLEHPRSVTRGVKACLTLAGAAAAGVVALTAATSPAGPAEHSILS